MTTWKMYSESKPLFSDLYLVKFKDGCFLGEYGVCYYSQEHKSFGEFISFYDSERDEDDEAFVSCESIVAWAPFQRIDEEHKEKTAEQRLEEKVEIKEAINPEVTNLEYYKDEILENCLESLAVVKGRPKLCYKTSCNDCDFKLVQKGCHNKVKDWLKQTHKKPTYKLTKFEFDLLQSFLEGHPLRYQFKNINALTEMREKGYFRGVNRDATIEDILANCEVVG